MIMEGYEFYFERKREGESLLKGGQLEEREVGSTFWRGD